MNNQDLFNLQEAYLGIYERFVPPTKEKAERIKDFLNQAGDKSASNAKELRAARQKLAAAAADPTKTKPNTGELLRNTKSLTKRAKNAAAALSPQNNIRPKRKTSNLVFLSRNNPNSPGNNIRDFIRKEEYDIVVPYLLDEGYAKTLHGAEAIMANMSEEWREEIIVEARHEKHEISKLPDNLIKSNPNLFKTIKRAFRSQRNVPKQPTDRQRKLGHKLSALRYRNQESDMEATGSRRGPESPTDR